MVDRTNLESRLEPVFGGSLRDHVLGVVASPAGAKTPKEVRLDAARGFDSRAFIAALIANPLRAKSDLDIRVDASLGFSLKDYVSSVLPAAPGGGDTGGEDPMEGGVPTFPPNVPIPVPALGETNRPAPISEGSPAFAVENGDDIRFLDPAVGLFVPFWRKFDDVPASFEKSFGWTVTTPNNVATQPFGSMAAMCFMTWPADSVYASYVGGAGSGYFQASMGGQMYAGPELPLPNVKNVFTYASTRANLEASYAQGLAEFDGYGITFYLKAIGFSITVGANAASNGETSWLVSDY